MKLELKHLAPYLPYGLKVKTKYGCDTMQTLNEFCVNGDCEEWYSYEGDDELLEFKPILRPLTDLTKMTKIGKDNFEPLERLKCIDLGYTDWISNEREGWINKYGRERWIGVIPSALINLLFEWHFDVFGLIDAGLAIDINTL